MRKNYEELLECPNVEDIRQIEPIIDYCDEQIKKDRKRRNNAANIFVTISLVMCIIITLVVLYDYHRLDIVLGSGEITALMALWGGELLIIALRQIFGSDVLHKRKEEEDEE